MENDFKLRSFDFTFNGFDESIRSTVLASTRGKALAEAWRHDIFHGYTFKEFLKYARCKLSPFQPKPEVVYVEGKKAYKIDHNRAYVNIVYPDTDVILSCHPYDIEPVEARPEQYR